MFNETCSEDREGGGTCGICGDVSSEEGSAASSLRICASKPRCINNCTFCAYYSDECCMPFAAADDTIHDAVSAWLEDEASARQTYGDISMWDTSEVTDMSYLGCSGSESDCHGLYKPLGTKFNC